MASHSFHLAFDTAAVPAPALDRVASAEMWRIGPRVSPGERAAPYLLDTNVISELRKRKPNAAVLAWVRRVPEDSLFVSVATLGQVQAEIEMTRERDAAGARAMERWLDDLPWKYAVVEADGAIFRRWAQLMHRRFDHPLANGLIAATALVRGLTVATRNVDDFKTFGVNLVNPFS